jgi:hypothetical protein
MRLPNPVVPPTIRKPSFVAERIKQQRDTINPRKMRLLFDGVYFGAALLTSAAMSANYAP